MNILLVDDSRSVRSLTAHYLREMGHSVLEAQDGRCALGAYETTSPDLILMDVEMPVMDGYETARRIRQQSGKEQWIPIIFLSGRVEDADIMLGIEAGGDDYLSKPVSPVVLRAKINAMERITDMRRRLVETGSELQRANERLRKLSLQDGLTGIANRRCLDDSLRAEWQRAIAQRSALSVILGDVDFFKRYNDHYGHQSGDECLRAVARALSSAARATDLVARYGGEEFAVLLPATSIKDAEAAAVRLVRAVQQLALPHATSDAAPHVTISLGVACTVPDRQTEPESLVQWADRALYEAKAQGRNRYVSYAGTAPSGAASGSQRPESRVLPVEH